MKKYLEFVEIETRRKTKIFNVHNKKSGEMLGELKWFSNWRKYCYLSWYAEIWYDTNCLQEIANFLNKLNKKS